MVVINPFFGYAASKLRRLPFCLHLQRCFVPPALELHDIRDVFAFAGAIVERSNLDLSYHDRDDLRAYLASECWRPSLIYERGDPRYPPRFTVYASAILRKRCVDWIRTKNGRTKWSFANGRTYERKRTELVSLDGTERDQLDAALSSRSGDPANDCDSDLAGLLGDRGRADAWSYDVLGLEPPRRAA